MTDSTGDKPCGCDVIDGFIYICPHHYGEMLRDSSVNYGLVTKDD